MKIEKLYKELEEWGCDVQGAKERFDDDELFATCIDLFLEDENLEKLNEEIKNNDCQESFNAAHTIKGVAANLGLTPIYDAVSDVVQELRVGKLEAGKAFMPKLNGEMEKMVEIVKNCQDD